MCEVQSLTLAPQNKQNNKNITCFPENLFSLHLVGGSILLKLLPQVTGFLCGAHHFLLVFSSVVAVYLKESWWSTEDVLRTSDPTREGLVKVR
jgi:hypothetical protein